MNVEDKKKFVATVLETVNEGTRSTVLIAMGHDGQCRVSTSGNLTDIVYMKENLQHFTNEVLAGRIKMGEQK